MIPLRHYFFFFAAAERKSGAGPSSYLTQGLEAAHQPRPRLARRNDVVDVAARRRLEGVAEALNTLADRGATLAAMELSLAVGALAIVVVAQSVLLAMLLSEV